MHEAVPYIVVLQLIITLALAVLLFGLARQVGILHERVAPLGAMTSDHGPEVGGPAPRLSVITLDEKRLELGAASERSRACLLLFVAPTCPVCKKLLPIARSFANAERIDIMLVGDGDIAEQRALIRQFGLEDLPYINSPQVGLTYRVAKLPYAVLIDAEGIIRAKGLVNNREHLESLVVAEETGFGTIQSYLAAKQRAAPQEPGPESRAHGSASHGSDVARELSQL